MTEEELLIKLREAFKSEAEERLAAMSSSLLELEKTSEEDRRPILEKAFREAHSLKGAARAVDVLEIESLCQSLESVFASIKENQISLSAELFDALHSSVGVMEDCLTVLEEDAPQNPEEIATLLHSLEELKRSSGRRAEDKGEKQRDRRRKTEDQWPDRRDRKEEGGTDKGTVTEPNELSREARLTQSRPLFSETVRISTSKLDSLLLKAE